jgi:periplasmic protein TonB
MTPCHGAVRFNWDRFRTSCVAETTMQGLQALHPYPMIQAWRERSPAAIMLAVGLLLAVGLFALIWTIIHSPEPTLRQPRIIRLLLVPPIPPHRPPEPARETVQRVPQAPPPVPVPPKKLVQQRRDSVAAAPTPKPKPAPPQPKTRSPAVSDPLSLDDAPPDWRQFALPKGANAGNVIGGNGDNGGGSGCDGASSYLTIVTSQIRNVFSRDQKMDGRTFHIQAQLWFDDLGTVQRSQLLQSTGKAELDASIKTLLGEVNVGRGMPQCIQPVTAWINQPWDGNAMAADAHTEVWQSRARN